MGEMMSINKDDLKGIIEVAFERGMQWSDTYKGWFIPTDEQTQNEINNVNETIMETLQIVQNMRIKE